MIVTALWRLKPMSGSSERARARPRGPARKIEHLLGREAVELLHIIGGGVLAAAAGRALIDRRQQVTALDVGEEIHRLLRQTAAIRTIDVAVAVQVETGGPEAL